jgi:hypothetical protein
MDVPQPVVASLVASGFPFQTAVTEVVRQLSSWEIVREEFPWRDDDGTDQFLDIVATTGQFVVTIECKKTQKDTLTFLCPDPGGHPTHRARCLYLQQIQDSTQRMELFSNDCKLAPDSVESMFCVVSTSESGKNQRLLEKDAQLLVRGTDAYALLLKQHFKVLSQREQNRYVVPVIVTNAPIFVAQYRPSNVSLESGQLAMPPDATIAPAELVRFRKAFTSFHGRDIGDRSVLVVAAPSLSKVLGALGEVEVPPEEGRLHFQMAG